MIVFLEITFLSYFWHFKRNLFVFPAEFVPFNIPCSYCFLVGLFLKENSNSQVLNKTNSLLLVVLCQVLLCMLILLSKIADHVHF